MVGTYLKVERTKHKPLWEIKHKINKRITNRRENSPKVAASKAKQLLLDLTTPGFASSAHSVLSSMALEALLLNCSKKLSICVSKFVGEFAIVHFYENAESIQISN